VDNVAVETFKVPWVIDIVASLAWAISGAIVARHRGFDFIGLFVIAVVSTTGGGLLRDGVFLQRIPVMLTDPTYLLLALAATCVMSVLGGPLERFQWREGLINTVDAFGTPAYALIGYQISLQAGLPVVGAMFVGVANGVAGGMIRDILVGEVPRVLRPGQHLSGIMIMALLLYTVLIYETGLDSYAASWMVIILATIARLLVIRFNWTTQAVNEWRIESTLSGIPANLSRSGKMPWGKRPHDREENGHEK
jgi:uncharacterized membrane protein YeiH